MRWKRYYDREGAQRGTAAKVLVARLAPGHAGLYRVNIQTPQLSAASTILRIFIPLPAAIRLRSAFVAARKDRRVRYIREDMQKIGRFERDGRPFYGSIEGQQVSEFEGGLFNGSGNLALNGKLHPIDGLKLLAPVAPPKILAVGLNYKSHLGTRPAPTNPEIFYKPVTALQHPEEPIVIPPDAQDVHFEGELVVVIGRTVRNANREEAAAAVFGVTCGNDVSDRNWQRGPNADRQWWRAKGCDTFAPLGPWIVTGIKYDDLALRTRVNGEVLQEQRTSDLIFDVPQTVSFVSRFVTLTPGDLIYTGTPGNTRKMNPGDVVEVEIENIGVLRNPVK